MNDGAFYNYARSVRAFDDQSHDECNCEICHQWHRDEGLVKKFSKLPDYDCCREEIEERVRDGTWCSYHDTDEFMHEKKCLECEMKHNEQRP